jgi:two-component system sensor histidine kinase MprB
VIPRTLRGRIVLAAAGAVLLAVFAFGMAASRYVGHELRSTTDRSLRDRAGDVARLSASAPALLHSPGTLDAASGGRQIDVEVLDRRGRVVGRSLSLGARLLPQAPAVAAALAVDGRAGYASVRIAGHPVRLYAAPLPDTGGAGAGGAVIVASRTDDIGEITHGIRTGLLIVGVLAALLGAAVAAGLVAGAIRPLRRLSAAAGRIEATGDVGERLPEPAGAAEVQDLAAALNGMLLALQDTRERERRMLADASHELRTPLTALAGNVDHLAKHGADPELIADLRHDTARLRRLVDDLLALERERAAPTPTQRVQLGALVAEAAAADDRVTPQIDDDVAVTGDGDALRRAVANLVENALVHGPPDGAVLVRLWRDDDARACIAVTDAGRGIPPAERDAAFERFSRGPDSAGRPGAGLGLAIVRATSRRHGGEAWADGSTVTIALPAADGDPVPETVPG